ncbi:sugar phosphate isomerase/epimerase family protein [Reinekea forsetii]|jgi:sugar phosphate isomerase/epimerase|uniref:Xylose isomerase n=1 Tax=Reinekea forsetii TaxID=1336806 RepID=A0A2K8KQN8_9GAMM|nr:sugar phosphate isomerase/epimerase [Reinekea forsetii]ATX77055.1 xylose isomerase [Reinekea forsetii]
MLERLSGLADEAGRNLTQQIDAHQQLNWQFMELRNIDGMPVDELSGVLAKSVAKQLADAGLQVNCLASRIGNWQRSIDTDLEQEEDELARLIDLSHFVGSRHIRVMSYLQGYLEINEWRDRVLERLTRLTARAAQGGLVLLHENCTGWAGIDAQNTQIMLKEITSPSLQLLLDLGNGPAYQNAPEDFITSCFDSIAHVHIKDAVRTANGKIDYCFPGKGAVHLLENIKQLLKLGYNGLFSIEPHIDMIAHEGGRQLDVDGINEHYIAYGQAALELLQQAKNDLSRAKTFAEVAI